MTGENIKAILFDFGGTIDYDGKNWGIRLYEKFKDQGITLDKDKLLEAGKRAMSLLYNEDRSKGLGYKETVDVYIYWTLKYMDLTVEKYKATLVEPFYNESIDMIEKNKKVLKLLKDHYKLGIVSNNFGNCIGWCKKLGIGKYFDIIIDSTNVGLMKPNEKIFLLGAEQIGVEASSCAYVGDKYEVDIEVPSKLGMMPIWLNSEEDLESHSDIKRIKTLNDLLSVFEINENVKMLL